MDSPTFWVGGLIAVTAAMMTVTRRNAVASVMWLVAAFVGMSVLFLGMNAGFIAVIQVLVYAGAIMVLFLFVIMLLNLSPAGLLRIDRPRMKVFALAASVGVVAIIIATAIRSSEWSIGGTPEAIAKRSGGTIIEGNALALSDRLFDQHLLPFEVTSVLLLVAIIGAVALTKKKV
ncbi:MAG: NADH-quinone oxidoreductase subunit J [Planctomycetes bacterium]|nr:NADH-quinone oxidoreductase subunit J [Planctomycetota bacterium]